MIDPDHRANDLSSGAAPRTPCEEEFVQYLENKPISEAMEYAVAIYKDSYKSAILESFLLAEATDEQINNALKIPRTVLNIYRSMFFDVGVFRDRLDMVAYAHSQPDGDAMEKWAKDLYISAVTLGSDYLIFKFCKNVDIDLAQALKSIISTSYMLSRAAQLNVMDSNLTKEARQWAVLASKSMESYVKVQPATEQKTDELRIALVSIERTTTEAKEQGLKIDEIVH